MEAEREKGGVFPIAAGLTADVVFHKEISDIQKAVHSGQADFEGFFGGGD